MRRQRRRGWGAIALCLIGVATVLAPVAYRNRAVGSEWHLTTSQFGPNFYIGNGADANGLYAPLVADHGDALYEQDDATSLAEEAVGRELSPRDVSRYWTRRAVEDIAHEPIAWLRLLARKLWISYADFEVIDTEDQYTYAEYSWILSSLMRIWGMGVLVPLAMFGAVLLFRRRGWRRRFGWPVLMMAGYTASLLLFFILARYRFPLVPPLMLIAATGLWEARRLVWKWAGQAHRGRRAAWARRVVPVMSVAMLAAALTGVPLSRDVHSVAIAKGVTRDNLGKHFYFAGFPESMVRRQFERAIRICPEMTRIRIHYAEILWAWGYSDEAREQLTAALRIDPDDAALLTRYGLMLAWMEQFEDSTQWLREATRLAPDAPEPHYHLATTLLWWADHAAARGLSIVGGSRGAANRNGGGFSIAEIQGMRREAVSHLRRSAALAGDSEPVHSALGHALARLNQPEAAAEEFRKAANRAPRG